jgi:hypothetical protein
MGIGCGKEYIFSVKERRGEEDHTPHATCMRARGPQTATARAASAFIGAADDQAYSL